MGRKTSAAAGAPASPQLPPPAADPTCCFRDLETEENLTATTSTGVKPTIRKEHSQSLDLEVSIANMLDSDDDDEQSENQMSDTKANLLTEYMSEKRLPRDQDQLKYWQINSKERVVLLQWRQKTDLMMMMIRKISARKVTDTDTDTDFFFTSDIREYGYGYGYPEHH
ncbi:hypothetical protein EVAR_70935_1 [Eumeta japonica]|uniref:Uncharacterized protein n=1 Tax=Eumeta variegata TaxID=151549 RepID=A0A4C2A8V8_EUMVA|nr:hypothetical protein EVAR_70935_1 [Eumeta japonica]